MHISHHQITEVSRSEALQHQGYNLEKLLQVTRTRFKVHNAGKEFNFLLRFAKIEIAVH